MHTTKQTEIRRQKFVEDRFPRLPRDVYTVELTPVSQFRQLNLDIQGVDSKRNKKTFDITNLVEYSVYVQPITGYAMYSILLGRPHR